MYISQNKLFTCQKAARYTCIAYARKPPRTKRKRANLSGVIMQNVSDRGESVVSLFDRHAAGQHTATTHRWQTSYTTVRSSTSSSCFADCSRPNAALARSASWRNRPLVASTLRKACSCSAWRRTCVSRDLTCAAALFCDASVRPCLNCVRVYRNSGEDG